MCECECVCTCVKGIRESGEGSTSSDAIELGRLDSRNLSVKVAAENERNMKKRGKPSLSVSRTNHATSTRLVAPSSMSELVEDDEHDGYLGTYYLITRYCHPRIPRDYLPKVPT